MTNRADFLFTIGYDGGVAIVDGSAKRKYGSLSGAELAERGLFRPAFRSALLSGDRAELAAALAAYNAASGAGLTADSPLDRMFGVFRVEAPRVKIL
jgi:hypothetical protein